MSRFSTVEQMWKSFGLEEDSGYRFQGKLEDVFGFYLFRAYPPALGLADREGVIKVIDRNAADVTEIEIQVHIRDGGGIWGGRGPIDIMTSNITYDHRNGRFTLSGKQASGKEVLDFSWGLHLSPTFPIRGFPLRAKRKFAQFIRAICFFCNRVGEWMLESMFGYTLQKKLENIHRGYSSSQMIVNEKKRTVLSLGESATFDVFNVKVKTTSGLYWCIIVAIISVTKGHFPQRLSGILSNATFSLAWSILLLWIIDKVLPRFILHFVNLSMRLGFSLIWRFASIRAKWGFYF